MPDQSDRLSFYQALFSMIKIDELDEIKDELQDKFGKFPVIVERLILTAVLRFYSSFAQFERIVITRKKITLILPKGENEDFYKNKFYFKHLKLNLIYLGTQVRCTRTFPLEVQSNINNFKLTIGGQIVFLFF